MLWIRLKFHSGDKMNWIDEVQTKLKKKNQVLLSKDSPYLQDVRQLFQEQNHRVMVLWAFDFAAETIKELKEKYPNENRPQQALETAKDWAAGKIKMRLAQQSILACHAFAKDIDCKEDIAMCHAVGQACAVVHTAGHAIGYPIYDLTSIIYKYGIKNCSRAIEARKQKYIDRLFYWRDHLTEYTGGWAEFMLK